MSEDSILSDDLVRRLIGVGQVDILVGVPTHNHAGTVAHVVQEVRAGLLKYFPRDRVAVFNADGGSDDGTPELIQSASISDVRNSGAPSVLRTLHCISSRYSGRPSSTSALHAIMAAANLLQAKACAVVSPESTTITPDWMGSLLQPVYREGFDFVAPVYRRHCFEGVLVTSLLYPMTRALYGRRVREPYPGEFCFSVGFGEHLMSGDFWRQDAGHAGQELYLTLAAITGGFRLHQAYLGPKAHVEHASSDLVHAMRQAVGTLFWSLSENFSTWSALHKTQPVPTTGSEYSITTESVRVNRKRLHQMFCSGVGELEPVLISILTPQTLAELKHAASLPEEQFRYPDELWVKTIYEFAASYHRSVISRDHVIQALAPLYRGRVYYFMAENRRSSEKEVEQHIETLCLTFERLKPYLLELWSAEEGGS